MEFKSFYKTVGGGEGDKCHYPTRLDTYGCGCQHDCSYCYAKSLLSFRGLWNASDPSIADIKKIRRKIKKIPKGSIVRLGGMTDCFQPAERKHKVTLDTIHALNEAGIGYLIVTKSDLIAEPKYIMALDRKLAHIQITVTTLDDDLYNRLGYEKAPLPSRRIIAVKMLQDMGFDVCIRLSPLIKQLMDFELLNMFGINKCVVEFLRVNSWVEKWFGSIIDASEYTLKEGGYRHLPLESKIELINKIQIPSISVCEDVQEHYDYWKEHFNPNPEDCCNLRKE